MEGFTWEQQGSGTYTLDLRMTVDPDGTITAQNLKQSGQEKSYNSEQECLDDFRSAIQGATGQQR